MTITKPNKRVRLVSYDHSTPTKKCSLRKKGLSPPSLVLPSVEPGLSAFSKTQTSGNPAHHRQRTVSPTPNAADKRIDAIPIKGVYFENKRVIDTRLYPAQMKYNPFHVPNLPELPIGVPLAKPPRLPLARLTKYGESLPVPKASTARVTPTNERDSPSIEMSCKEKEAKEEEKPPKHTRGHRRVVSITNKVNELSKEEQVFLEAAALLSKFRKKETPSN